MAGAIEGNSPFQTVWLPEPERQARLRQVHALAEKKGFAASVPIVFEGNAPADIRGNPLMITLLDSHPVESGQTPRIWMGAPNAIKGPTEALFRNRSGSNLLLCGQNEESSLALLLHGLIALAAQLRGTASKIHFLDASASNSPERENLDRVVSALPAPPRIFSPSDLAEVLDLLRARLLQNETDHNPEPDFLFIHGLQNFKKLRFEDEFSYSAASNEQETPAALFSEIITQGAARGIHIITSVDNYNNVNRFLGRKLLAEFEMRILFQMSANDSVSLCDSPKANLLGLHRALFYNEQEGTLETFRPYNLPDPEWLDEVRQKLSTSKI
jgi:hypothetical protein